MYCRHLCVSQFLHPRSVVLRESTDKGLQTRLMVLGVKPLSMPAFEGGFQEKDEEIPIRSGLNADSTHHMAFGGAWLIFQEEIMLEKGKIWKDGEISCTKMDKDWHVENGVSVKMDELNLVKIEQAT
jgi:hypothetical protein